ncbi:DNA repair protein RadA [Allofrancisella frigidaquae]|uniref:DNA repair protein RadA n=1 Tax=Allofrancisella frigidaquae TaxID=1085644 RepID=A0A6M3HYT2_9GAMM|nr:DNA repair protein RadA [Allofrancisella frigidaquae]QIV94826.1 DNA repair protein RadA [Allofrancisella frigidaquae]
MAKHKTAFICQECGATSPRWQGQCHSCNQWDTFVEEIQTDTKKPAKSRMGFAGSVSKAISLGEIKGKEHTRTSTYIQEFDRVLGGGIVKGSVTLVGGDPGIGKSSILLQIMAVLSLKKKVLYVSGEESLEQIALRAERLDLPKDNLLVMCETNIETIADYIIKNKPEVVVIDSIQTIYNPELQSMVGGVSQVRESTAYITQVAKQYDISVFLVGHVTKSGDVAGPRVLEHIVDAVVFIESQDNGRYRLMRTLKNRFGAVNEIGVFAMTDKGMKEVKNPSAIFLNNGRTNLIGSVIVSVWEGTRPLLVELQSLVVDKNINQPPKRLCVGIDNNRLAMILAIVQRYMHLDLYDKDVFLNVVGGIKITETSIDLALISIIYSSVKELEIPHDMLIMGEVGLSGEIRPIPYGVERINEAKKHGFKKIIVPKANISKLVKNDNVEITGITNLNQLKDIITG